MIPPEDIQCRKLWAETMMSALRIVCDDTVLLRPGDRILKYRTIDWFKSDNEFIGSFLWVCDCLGLFPGRIRAALADPGQRKLIKNRICYDIHSDDEDSPEWEAPYERDRECGSGLQL